MPAKTPRKTEPARPAPTPPPAWQATLSRFGTNRAAFVAASVALLVPVFWQARPQAGDLGSHIYNAWLAQLIGQGRAPGLTIGHQSTNVLFDLLLGWLLPAVGAAWAERIAVSLAVLAFGWGAFAFVSASAGRRAWHMLPAIAILAYGWVYHMGFFNFYLSLGLAFGAMALVWRRFDAVHAAGAVALLALAWTAHALPVAWACGLMVYRWVVGRIGKQRQALAAGAGVFALLAIRVALGSAMPVRWFPTQAWLVTGADQGWVYDAKYILATAALLALWLPLARQVKLSAPFHFWLLTAAAIAVLPDVVLPPGYKHQLAYVSNRMSLAAAVCICAWLAPARFARVHYWTTAAAALIFFSFLFRDEMVFNEVEARIDQAVARLPSGQRVIGGLNDPKLRAGALSHMVDRACVGRCFSFDNYEPSTAQFRVRATGPNPIVAWTYDQSWQMQTGQYVVQPGDLPLYQVTLGDDGGFVVVSLKAGVRSGIKEWDPL